MINTIVFLLDIVNGAFGVYRQERDASFDENTGEYNTYWWTEGNASCDCNRSIFLYGVDEEEMHLQCSGRHNRIKILSIVREDTGDLMWEGDYVG